MHRSCYIPYSMSNKKAYFYACHAYAVATTRGIPYMHIKRGCVNGVFVPTGGLRDQIIFAPLPTATKYFLHNLFRHSILCRTKYWLYPLHL
jgi:hypothetical protein